MIFIFLEATTVQIEGTIFLSLILTANNGLRFYRSTIRHLQLVTGIQQL